MDHLCFLCLVFLMLSRLFIAALWSSAGKGLTSWLLLVMFIVFLLLSNVVSWVRCGTLLYRFLVFAVFLTMKTSFSLNGTDVSVLALHIIAQDYATRMHNDRKACMWCMAVLFVRCHYNRAGKVITHTTQHKELRA